jgi:TRAP-type C4-dicarboxylate transport system permease small subunit
VKDSQRKSLDFMIRNFDWLIVVALFWTLAVIVFAQFIMRYGFGSSIIWSEEIARTLLIALTFLGCAIATRRNTNISIEVIFAYIPLSWARFFVTLVDLAKIMLSASLTYMGYTLTMTTRQKLTSIDLSKSWLYGAVTTFLALMTIYAGIIAFRHWKAGKADISVDAEKAPNI